MPVVKVTDECLWLKHIEDCPLRDALASLVAGSQIRLTVNGSEVIFERMAIGKDGRETFGFKPVKPSNETWRALYMSGQETNVELQFAGAKTNG